jgi:hypothetical protein
MVNWDFVVLFGTIMFWALLHVWSPDGKQWRTDRVERRKADVDALTAEVATVAEVAPARRPRQR